MQQTQFRGGSLEFVAPLLAGDKVLLDITANFLGLMRDHRALVIAYRLESACMRLLFADNLLELLNPKLLRCLRDQGRY